MAVVVVVITDGGQLWMVQCQVNKYPSQRRLSERPALGRNVPVAVPLMCSGIDWGQPTGSVVLAQSGGESCRTATGSARQPCSMQQEV